MLRMMALSAASFSTLVTCFGCDAVGRFLLTTGAVGGNIRLIELIGRGLGFPIL